MRELEEDDEEVYKRQFAKYLEQDLDADKLEDMYTDAHAKIREAPEYVAKTHLYDDEAKTKLKKFKSQKRNLKQRQDRIKQKKAAWIAARAAQE